MLTQAGLVDAIRRFFPDAVQLRSAASLCVLLLGACGVSTPAIDLDAEREAVRELMARGTRALEQHDWNVYSTFWANDPDVSVIHPASREWVDGWDGIASKYRAVIADSSAQIRASNLRQDIHVAPSGDMAWVTQQDSLHFTGRGQTTAVLQWSTAVFEKRRGEWRAVHGHAAQFVARQ